MLAVVGALVGLHSASWGAYKDSPYESFQIKKFFRSVILGALLALFGMLFLRMEGVTTINLGVMWGFTMILERGFTEFIKAYIRDEPQDKYRIPSTVHVLGRVIKNKSKRLLTGLVFTLGFILFTLFVFSITSGSSSNKLVSGMLFGFIGGMLIALGGGLKDAPIEGFERIKFMRSPFIALIAGGFLSYFTENYGVIMLSSMGVERMVTEAYKSFLKAQGPGKFKSGRPTNREWIEKRRVLIIPYLITWLMLAVLFKFGITF